MIPDETYRQWVTILEGQIQSKVVSGHSPDEAYAWVREKSKAEFGWNPEGLERRMRAVEEAAISYQQKLERVSYMQKVAVRFGREHWYAGPAEEAENWNGLRRYLEEVKQRAGGVLEGIDQESTTVISLLDNPGKAEFRTRGLVVGYVQSGKTTNMAAVIAKAADTPFKFFLVLSGMTDALRNQTQERLDQDVIATAPRNRWLRWTSVDTEERKGDFGHPAVGGFAFDHRKQLAVIKKNGGVLRRFLAKLKNTDEATLRNTPFLIIDDECDHASLNSAALEKAVTRINGYIREILVSLPRAAYVGYTATPFANVLIDPSVPEDLYPRSFIHALSCPKDYFGAERLFGRADLDGDHDDRESGLDMIRTIQEHEIASLRPTSGAKQAFSFDVTDSLADAIRYFILVTAAREVRGQASEHSTMLVHTSVLNTIHRKTERAVRHFLANLTTQIQSDDEEAICALRNLWDREQDRVLAEMFDLSPVSFDRLRPVLSGVASSIEIKVENWSSDNRIDYSLPARRYLVIGGNVLARGLTLEGLSVSFFLRSSSQYDTLMQMGRWFGYRPGFADLPRVWMEDSVKQSFFDLATIEAEVRRDIRRYADEEITPLDFGIRIRCLPGMTITARAKMRNVKTVEIGYAGSHQQTTRFHRADTVWLTRNWDAGSDLVAAGRLETVRQAQVLHTVAMKDVVAFLERYQVHESHRQMTPELLIKYIQQQELNVWNVAVVGTTDESRSERELGRLGRVSVVRRSALKGSTRDACIKALMSKRDVLVDVADPPRATVASDWEFYKNVRAERGLPPLLLLYPIERQSSPHRQGLGQRSSDGDREPLGAVHDVLGIGVVFPGAHARARAYVAANLTPLEAEEVPEGDDEVPTAVTEPDQGV